MASRSLEGANIRRQSRIICERVEARLHRYLPEGAASLQVGAKHCGQDNAFHLGIREKDRSARESHELARMIFFLSEFSRPFALGVPACHVVALAKTEASREGGFVV